MNGSRAIAVLADIADKLETLATSIEFNDDESFEVEDAWNVVQEAVYSLDQTLQVQFEMVFLRRAKENRAPKLDTEVLPI